MTTFDPRDIIAEVEDLIRTMPDLAYGWNEPASLDWLGRVKAILSLPQLGVFTEAHVAIMQASSDDSWRGKTSIQVLLSQVRHALRMQTIGPLAVAVNKGMVFDYFDSLKKIIEEARTDILIVDPYMDAEFVPRYLPFVSKATAIRLLASKHVSRLAPAAALFAQQNQATIEVRRASSMHDRFVFVDGKRGFQSGSSFHQGGVNSPTTLTEITDTFSAVRTIYEDMWSGSQAVN